MKGASDKFRTVADMVETIETIGTMQSDRDITHLTPREENLLTTNPTLTFQMKIPFLSESDNNISLLVTPKTVTLTEDGDLQIEFVAKVPPSDPDDLTEPSSLRAQSDSDESEPEGKAMTESKETDDETADTKSANNTSPTGDVTPPAYRDPERLQEVYDEYDTFTEMTGALDVDVTPQTVRRYAIKYEIHEPASNTGSQSAEKLLDADPDSVSGSPEEDTSEEAKSIANRPAQVEARNTSAPSRISTDGHGGVRDYDKNEDRLSGNCDEIKDDIEACLPEHLTLDDIKTAARSAKTLYEAQQQLDLEREEARRLLRELDLLDFVHGRLATRDVSDQTIEDLNKRLQTITKTDSGRA